MRNKHKSKYLSNRNRFTMGEDVSTVKENAIPLLMKIAVMFSNVLASIGLVFAIFGSVFLLVFMSSMTFNSFSVPDNSPTVGGEIVRIEGTNTFINDRQVFKYHYEYTGLNGMHYSGASFASMRYDRPGDNISVRYNEEKPEESVIVGMDTEELSNWLILFLLIFPIIGFTLLYFGVKKGYRNVKIIQFGKVAFGSYNRKESTNATVNNQTVYKFFFDFKVADGNTYQATGETYKTYKLEDEDREPVIYNSGNPEEAVLVDTLPKSVRRFFKVEINKTKDTI